MRTLSRTGLAVILGITGGLLGCSTTRTTRIITETESGPWRVGQHDYCFYEGGKLLCKPQGKEVQIPVQLAEQPKEGKQITAEEMLFADFMAEIDMRDVQGKIEKEDKTW